VTHVEARDRGYCEAVFVELLNVAGSDQVGCGINLLCLHRYQCGVWALDDFELQLIDFWAVLSESQWNDRSNEE
jgi:hypothetical protein